MMAAYYKFSDMLQIEGSTAPPPKPAKAPKVDSIEAGTLGGLGALGGAEPQTGNSVPATGLPASPSPTSADRALARWAEAEAERAAIIEHDGAIPREWAEGF